MSELRYQFLKRKNNLVISFWHRVPRSWLYWAVNSAWAKATSEKYTNKHPDEITWSMVQRWLKPDKQRGE